MKVCKIIFNIFGILLAIVFSILTFSTLLTTPVISAGTSLLQPETIQQVLQDMNLSEQLESTLKNSAPADLQNLDMNFIDDLMASDLMSDILQLYIDNMMCVLEKDHMESISHQQVQNLLTQHTPDLVEMFRPYLPTEIPFSDADISQYAINILEPALITMVSSLPTLEDMGIDSTTLTLIHMLYNGTLLKCSIIAIGILSLIVFLCRFPRFKGFMWLGITYLLSAVILFLASGNIDSFVNSLLLDNTAEHMNFAIQPIIELFKKEFATGTRNIIILSAIFIAIFILGRILLSTKKKTVNEEIAA